MDDIHFERSDFSETCDKWLLKELKQICKKLGLKVSGNKGELCKRINIYYDEKLKEHQPNTSQSATQFLFNLDDFADYITARILDDKNPLENLNKNCHINKSFNNYCQSYKFSLQKKIMDRFKIQYNDPNNFIYEWKSSKKIEKTDSPIFNIYKTTIKNDKVQEEYNKKSSKELIKDLNGPNGMYAINSIFNMFLRWYKSMRKVSFINVDQANIDKMIPHILAADNLRKLNIFNVDHQSIVTIEDIPFIPSLEILIISHVDLKSEKIPSLPNLIKLKVENSNIKTMGLYPKLEELTLSNVKNIKSIPLFPNLVDLVYKPISENNEQYINFDEFPNFPELKTFECSSLRMKKLPSFPKLQKLHCENCHFNILQSFPTLIELNILNCIIETFEDQLKLVNLSCIEFNLQTLPSLPELQKLNCENCLFDILPSFPNLIRLNIENCDIESFEDQLNVTYMSCIHTNLTSLPSCPNLTNLIIMDCNLESLPSLSELKTLNCDNNRLQSLPDLPKLEFLSCVNNRLTSLPLYPNIKQIEHILAQINPLTSLPPNIIYMGVLVREQVEKNQYQPQEHHTAELWFTDLFTGNNFGANSMEHYVFIRPLNIAPRSFDWSFENDDF
jgi:hypothetical protein